MDNNKHKQAAPTTGFYLPDLCQVKAVLFIVLVAELLAIVLTLSGSGIAAFDWQSFALKSLFCQWAFLSSAACLCQLRPWIRHMSLATGAAVSYVLVLVLVAALAVAGQWLMAGAIYGITWRFNFNDLVEVVIITAIIAGITLRYFYLSQELRQRQQAALQARIEALQSRIRPHFLFNSMNIIASLIAVDAKAAEKAVEDLSDLFRASLSDTNTQVSLKEELELCKSYARIEQNRLGERLKVEWQTDNVPMDLPIPSLTLQPLLENAIYHGIQNLVEGGTVSIQADYDGQWLNLSITNPYNAELDQYQGNQVAIPNIQHRLQALYGDEAELAMSNLGDEYKVVVSYPVKAGELP